MNPLASSYNLHSIVLVWLTLLKNVKTQPPANPSAVQCPETCSMTTAPCQCYRFGWVDCNNQHIESILFDLPDCVRRLVIKNNAIIDLSEIL